MFDVDELISACISANSESEPRLAIRDVLERAIAPESGIADALPPERAEIRRLHVSPELTVIKVVWAPGMTLFPHDHRMWAAIGIYTGGEDNAFFRRGEGGLVASGGKDLRPGDVCLLGDDVVHSVTNPTSMFAGAIHVYGGDFFTMPRSEFDPETLEERAFDVEGALRYFEEQNARFVK
jgi:predicted metal-dependent enzyme (double-stranded beta helix superfamily)